MRAYFASLKKKFKKPFVNPFHPNLTNNAAPYKAALATVDVATVNFEKGEVLLGRKKKEIYFRFIGGFVDPLKDKSILDAAKREKTEESGLFEVADWQIIGNPLMDDPRYQKDKDKIFTTFYVSKYIFGLPVAGDDIAEVQWFKIDELRKLDIMPVHYELLDIFRAWWKRQKHEQLENLA